MAAAAQAAWEVSAGDRWETAMNYSNLGVSGWSVFAAADEEYLAVVVAVAAAAFVDDSVEPAYAVAADDAWTGSDVTCHAELAAAVDAAAVEEET